VQIYKKSPRKSALGGMKSINRKGHKEGAKDAKKKYKKAKTGLGPVSALYN